MATNGVGAEFWCAVLKLLQRRHGGRYVEQGLINGLIESLGDVEEAWLAAPKVEKKRRAKRGD